MFKNTYKIVLLFVLSLLFSVSAHASLVSLTATEDTYITEHGGLDGPNSTHGSDNSLYLIRGTGVFRAFPLVKFDLTSYAGSSIVGPTVDFRINLLKHVFDGTQSVSVRESLVDWNEATASFANFGGTGFNAATQTGPNLVTQTVSDVISPLVEESILFSIASSVVQGWIDNPATNFGLILISNTTINQQDLIFSSKEGGIAPSLDFEVSTVPVPAAAWLFGSALLGFLGFSRRKTNA